MRFATDTRRHRTTNPDRRAEPIYLDASALVKLFVPEDESDTLNQALAGLTDVIVSDLALTEVAFARLLESVPDIGRAGRDGGDQFGMALPDPITRQL